MLDQLRLIMKKLCLTRLELRHQLVSEIVLRQCLDQIVVIVFMGILRTQKANARIVVMCVIVTMIRMSIAKTIVIMLILIIVTITHITIILASAC